MVGQIFKKRIPENSFYNQDSQFYQIIGKDNGVIEFGDSKQLNFYPRFKLLKWFNECNLSIGLDRGPNARFHASQSGDWVYEDDEKIVKLYSIENPPISNILERTRIIENTDGDVWEFEVIFSQRPAQNYIDFTLEHKNVSFHKWEATEEELHDPNRIIYENTLGAIILYHLENKTNNQYKYGEVMTIYRPKLVDAEGNYKWVDQELIENNTKLRIYLDSDFLDSAIYPIVIDPTYGNTNTGTGSGYTIPFQDAEFECAETASAPSGNIIQSMMCDHYNDNRCGFMKCGAVYSFTNRALRWESTTYDCNDSDVAYSGPNSTIGSDWRYLCGNACRYSIYYTGWGSFFYEQLVWQRGSYENKYWKYDIPGNGEPPMPSDLDSWTSGDRNDPYKCYVNYTTPPTPSPTKTPTPTPTPSPTPIPGLGWDVNSVTQADKINGVINTSIKTTNGYPAAPAGIRSGLQLWLDAGNIYSYPGSGNTWYDISGNNRNYTMTSPPWNAGGYFEWSSAGGFSGPASNSFEIPTSATSTLIVVGYTTSTSYASTFYQWYHTGSTRGLQSHYTWSDGVTYFDVNGCCGTGQRLSGTISPSVLNTLAVATFIVDPEGSNTREVRIDNTVKLSTTVATTIGSWDSTTAATIAPDWRGRLYEFIFYNRGLTNAELTAIHAELNTKYGL